MSEHVSWSPNSESTKCAGGKKPLLQLGNSSASLEALASTDLVVALECFTSETDAMQ